MTIPAEPASSILLIRDGASGLEVLMMRRAKTMAFAPGALVFPGGKVDHEDFSRTRWRKRITSPTFAGDTPIRIAALRELWEEVGILVGKNLPSSKRHGATITRALGRNGKLDTRRMVPFAHWVTPEGLPKRYDTFFYLVSDRRGHLPQADGHEALTAEWVNPRLILNAWEAGTVPLMFPTRLNLLKLARARSVAEALYQTRVTPVVRTLPIIGNRGQTRTVTISPAAGFGVTSATPRELAVEVPVRPKATR